MQPKGRVAQGCLTRAPGPHPAVAVPPPAGPGAPAPLHHPRCLERHAARGAAPGAGGVRARLLERLEPGGHGHPLDRYCGGRGVVGVARMFQLRRYVASHPQSGAEIATMYPLRILEGSQVGSSRRDLRDQLPVRLAVLVAAGAFGSPCGRQLPAGHRGAGGGSHSTA